MEESDRLNTLIATMDVLRRVSPIEKARTREIRDRLAAVRASAKDANDIIGTATNKIDELEKRTAQVEKISTDMPSQIEHAEKKLKNFEGRLAEAVEGSQLAMVKKLWMDREKTYKHAVEIGIALIAVGFGIPIAIIYIYFPELKNLLTTITGEGTGDAGLTVTLGVLNRLVFIGVPIALIFWILRIIIRFYTRSLVLLDDARQRVSTVDTYLQLIKENAVEDTDRPVVLEALLRRAPGQGPDSLEPASLTDLLRISRDTQK